MCEKTWSILCGNAGTICVMNGYYCFVIKTYFFLHPRLFDKHMEYISSNICFAGCVLFILAKLLSILRLMYFSNLNLRLPAAKIVGHITGYKSNRRLDYSIGCLVFFFGFLALAYKPKST
jgi:hypothetical protein